MAQPVPSIQRRLRASEHSAGRHRGTVGTNSDHTQQRTFASDPGGWWNKGCGTEPTERGLRRTHVSRLEEIQAAGATLSMHLNFGDGYGYVYRCVAEPRLTVHIQGPKGRKSKRQRSRVYRVQGIEDDFLTLEEAIAAVEKIDQGARDEQEWNAAAPRKPRPPPLLTDPHQPAAGTKGDEP